MQAIILAAWMGKRLWDLTLNNTKCMIKVNGITLIDRLLHQLDKKKLNRIIIVIWYKGDLLKEYISTLGIQTKIIYIENNIYNITNNIYSLSLAKNYLCEDNTLLFESDLIFEDSVIDELLNDKRSTLALVDKYESRMDWTCIKLDNNDNISWFITTDKFKFEESDCYYKTVNIYKFDKKFSKNKYVPFLDAYQRALGYNEYYEQVLRVITMLDNPEIKAKRLDWQLWYEIDDIQDLDIAESIFTPNEDKKTSLLQSRYWWYRRYPNLIDFCYLVNPYYPTERLIDEIKASFHRLLTQYPSSIRINSLLVSKDFKININNIVVGNGAAELIKSLMNIIKGNTWFIRPTFEEYPNRYKKENSIYMNIENKNYSYNKNDIIEYFKNQYINNLVIINPDNPSGNYIQKKDLIDLANWAKEKKIRLIIDESFSDFSDEEDNSLLDQEILKKYKNLIVLKSISKSYWVPWLRLGILSSWDKLLIDTIKKDISIWNINSFAEFFLQIAGKYNKDYIQSLKIFRNERMLLRTELNKIRWLRVIPSQANYFMLEIKEWITAKELTKRLLIKYNILVKDLTKKMNGKNYIRIAIRKNEENKKLIEALKNELWGKKLYKI